MSELKDLTKAQLIEKVVELQGELAAGTPAATDEVVAGLRQKVAELEGKLNASEQTESELQAMIRELNSRAQLDNSLREPGTPVVQHKGLSIRVLRAVMLWGERWDQQRIANSPAALDHLIEIGSGSIHIHS